MHIWTLDRWKNKYDKIGIEHRTGVRLRFDSDVDSEVRRAIKTFICWLRSEYYFPIRVPIYIKAKERIRASDGELVFGTCFLPFDHLIEPYIRIAVGDYKQIVEIHGQDNALAAILKCIAHELTHYFQWVNGLKLTPVGEERQAKQYSNFILDEYAQVCQHP